MADDRNHDEDDSTGTDPFRRALRRILRPIARAMIDRGIPLSAGLDLLKEALVEAAVRDVRHDGDPTDSRISLLTGVHRKDVRRLRRDEAPPVPRPGLNACALAIARWTTDPRFVDGMGDALPLALGRVGGPPRFDDLIRAARLDLPAATVAEELIRTGMVAEQEGSLHLLRAVFVPDGPSPDKIMAFEKNLHVHLHGAVDNLSDEPDRRRHFEMGGHFNRLSPDAVDALGIFAQQALLEALHKINAEALRHQDHDAEDEANDARFSFGAYAVKPDSIAKEEDEA